jgi:hypothetical protein
MAAPTTLTNKQNTDYLDLKRQEELTTARKQIKNAFQWTMFIGGVSSVIWLAGMSGAKLPNAPQSAESIWNILDLIFIFGMGYGISRNNKICAMLMFGYYVLGKIMQIHEGRLPVAGMFISCLGIYYLWMGIVGTNNYSRLMIEKNMSQPFAMSSDQYSETSAYQDQIPEPQKPTSEPLNPTAELLSACAGDRSQAHWLLSEIKIKHPSKSVAWCNQKAIQQLTGENTGTEE